MNVKEYAESVNLTVAEILKKCENLGIEVHSSSDYLNDDDVINLDFAINLISTDEETTIEDEEDIAEAVENIVANSNMAIVKEHQKKQKLKSKRDIASSKEEFMSKRKEMYKHKEKLQDNKHNDNVILYEEGMTVLQLADALEINATDIIKKLMGLGLMVGQNQPISYENAEIVTLEYNKVLKKEETQNVADFEHFEIIDNEEDLENRPAVVTIMGHVDHGKTTLLDYIRNSSVVETEFGGITQHIGAYQVKHNDKKITFIDTPGHAAFTEMRARGASVTDLVIIIVAADDGVMPQTQEAIDHAMSANVPIIVAVNKIDKEEANPDRVMQEMSENGIIPEEWGGSYPFVKISAVTGVGIDLLLETINTISEVNEYKANPNRYAVGTVIESKLDKNVGGVASLLIQNGTLRIGDPLVVGTTSGKVRTMKNDRGENIVEAKPSTPVEITGLNGNPSAGDKFMAFETEAEAKKIADERDRIEKDRSNKKESLSLDELFARIQSGIKEINIILKADVRGSEEAVRSSLEKISVGDVRVKVIRSGIGNITESDIVLANASNAIIIGFNVRPNNTTKELAKEYNVDVRLYTIIYKVVEEIEAAMNGMLDPEYEEKVLGDAEIRKIFKFSKVGNIAGVYVTNGIMKNGSDVRVIRDGMVIHEGKIATIQREKDTIKEVKKGLECGITLSSYNDIKEGDILENYEMVEVKR